MLTDTISEPEQMPAPHIGRHKRPELWQDYNYLCKAAKDISDCNRKNFKKRRRWRFNRHGEVDILSIPNADREKFGIPADNDKLAALIAALKAQDAEKKAARQEQAFDEDRAYQVWCDMLLAKKEFPAYYNRIKEKYTMPAERCREFAEKWAVWAWILINYCRFSLCLETYHAEYSKIFPGHFKAGNGKISFKNFMNRCQANGIEDTIIDSRAVVKVKDRRCPMQMEILKKVFVQSKMTGPMDAWKKLAAICAETDKKPMSHANVKIIFREFKQNMELYTAKNGATEAQKKMPTATLSRPEYKLSQVQIDGKTISFHAYGKDGEAKRYTLLFAIDVCTRYVVAWVCVESENTEAHIEIWDALMSTGYLPAEIIMDKFKLGNESGCVFISEYELMGGTFTATANPQAKAVVERYNSYFDETWKEYPNSKGKGALSRSSTARPSVEQAAENIKTKNWKTPEEIKALALVAVEALNNKPLDVLGGKTPAQMWAQTEIKHAFKVSEEDRVRLLRKARVYLIRRGEIIIKQGMVKHRFQLSAALYDKYNDCRVEVRFEDIKECIYLFEVHTGDFIATIQPKRIIPGAKVERTEEDNEELNKLYGRKKGIMAKARKSAEMITEALTAYPDDLDRLAGHFLPKDVRNEILSNAALKQAAAIAGVNTDMIPTRPGKQVSGAVAGKAAVTTGKTKERPFAAPDNEIRVLTMADLLNG